MLEEEGERCPSCDSANVEIVVQNELVFFVCHDCSVKQLLD